MDDFEEELIADFFVEATQLIDASEQAFLALERDKNNSDLINEIFRLAHTIKGSSRAVSFGEVAEFTHEVENLIMQLQKKRLEITSAVITLLLECNDHVRVMIDTLKVDRDAKFNSTALTAKIKQALVAK